MYPSKLAIFHSMAEWSICSSPIDLPVSDIALVQVPRGNAVYYVLPISPRLLLQGRIPLGTHQPRASSSINGENFSATEAEFWLGAICLSAITEMIALHRIDDVPTLRERAKRSGVAFAQIVRPERLASLGGRSIGDEQLAVRSCSTPDWVKFIHSFLLPPPGQMNEKASTPT